MLKKLKKKEEYPLMRGDVFVIHGGQAHGKKNV